MSSISAGAIGAELLAPKEPAHRLVIEPELPCALAPFRNELLRRDAVVLGPSSGERGDLRGAGARRTASLELGLDVRPPPAERPQDRRQGRRRRRRSRCAPAPTTPELARQQRPQPRLVEVAGGLRVRVDPATVERRPAPVGAEHDVGDEHVRVELRIAGPRRPMPERRRDQPAARNHVDAARPAARHAGRPLDVAERLGDRPIVRVTDRAAQLVVADPEQHADALRRRERQVEPRNPPVHDPPERRAAARMLAGEHAIEADRIDRPDEPERPPAVSDPDPGRFRPAEVVVLDARVQRTGPADGTVRLLEVVAGLADSELSDRQHVRAPGRRTADSGNPLRRLGHRRDNPRSRCGVVQRTGRRPRRAVWACRADAAEAAAESASRSNEPVPSMRSLLS